MAKKTDEPATPTAAADPAGRFAYGGLERVIHERARLSILSSLAAHDGNLSRQLTTLAEARLVETWKGTRNGRPQTRVKLTAVGRRRFADYIAELEAVVTDARRAADPARPTGRARRATA